MVSNGFLCREGFGSKNRDTLSSSNLAVPPEEVLFRRKRAPERYEEDDFYWADRHLTSAQPLPDSDLLKAIHTYSSDFYGRATIDKGLGDFQSMDGTALLALAILLEESAKDSLGENGDLVFVEGEELKPEDETDPMRESDDQSYEAKARTNSSSRASNKPKETMSRKKRKLNEIAAEGA